MRDECIEAVQDSNRQSTADISPPLKSATAPFARQTPGTPDALGRALQAGESKSIEDAVNMQMGLLARKDPAGWSAMPQSERLHQASIAAAEQLTAAAELKHRRIQLDIAAHDAMCE